MAKLLHVFDQSILCFGWKMAEGRPLFGTQSHIIRILIGKSKVKTGYMYIYIKSINVRMYL